MSDSLTTAAGMVIDAQGRVTYDFAGHVHARGLDLDASALATPPNDSRIRWLFPDGTPASELFGYGHQAPSSYKGLNIGAGAVDGSSADLAMIGFLADSGGLSSVSAQVSGGYFRTLIDSLGNAGYAQTPEGHRYVVFWDGVNLNFQVDGVVVKTL